MQYYVYDPDFLFVVQNRREHEDVIICARDMRVCWQYSENSNAKATKTKPEAELGKQPASMGIADRTKLDQLETGTAKTTLGPHRTHASNIVDSVCLLIDSVHELRLGNGAHQDVNLSLLANCDREVRDFKFECLIIKNLALLQKPPVS
jgi:hypothetical protein